MTLIRNYEGDKISRTQAIEVIDRLKADAPRAEHRDIYGYLGSYEMYSHEQELLTDTSTEERVVQSILDKVQSLYTSLLETPCQERYYTCDRWVASSGLSELEVNAILNEIPQLMDLYKFENNTLKANSNELLASSILDKYLRIYARGLAKYYGGE